MTPVAAEENPEPSPLPPGETGSGVSGSGPDAAETDRAGAADPEPGEVGAERGVGLRRAAVPGLLAVGAVGALAHLRHRFERSQMFLPDRYPNGVWDPRPYGLEADDVWFESEDGVSLHGWWLPHRKARGTILYCHGNSGHLASQIAAYRYLRQFRVNVFTFDYRGYGRSEGAPSEEGILADARAAHDELTGSLGQDPTQVVLYGHSLGGAVAIDCAVHRPAAGLIVQSSFTDTRQVARSRFGGVPLHLVAARRFRSIDKVRQLTLPKLILHGTDDATIPFAIGEELFEAAAEPKDWIAVPRAGHSDVHRHGGLRLRRRIGQFVRRVLREASAAATSRR